MDTNKVNCNCQKYAIETNSFNANFSLLILSMGSISGWDNNETKNKTIESS